MTSDSRKHKGPETQSEKPSNAAAGCSNNDHYHNVHVCTVIGGIAECNARYTAGISRRIAATGKRINDLTIGELLEIHISYGEWFNNLPSEQGAAQ